jgi:hypothetical protein
MTGGGSVRGRLRRQVIDRADGACEYCRTPQEHPRQHRWDEHFQWSDDFTMIIGTTPIGRATVDALNMNAPRMVSLRKLWVMMQVFPHDR